MTPPLNVTDQFALDGDRVFERMPIDLGHRESDPFPLAEPENRHVLIIEPSGWTYLGFHTPETTARHEQNRPGICYAIAEAARSFTSGPRPDLEPGRFWCDLDEDGVFLIGSRIPDEVTE